MRSGNIWTSEIALPDYAGNIASMVNANAFRFGTNAVYQEPRNGVYEILPWNVFHTHIRAIQKGLTTLGMQRGDRVAILSRNRKEMLEMELAIMSFGGVAVPIFAGFAKEQADLMVKFCEPTFVVVADQSQYDKVQVQSQYKAIIHFEEIDCRGNENAVDFSSLVSTDPGFDQVQGEEIQPDTICLMMYTSGTMGTPKCVMLAHGNILSQQAALRTLWDMSADDRFLSFLPWHHSFGGIFEKYAAITNGAVLALEDFFGKDIDGLLSNWEKVRPTVFFSVPKIYQEIISRTVHDKQISDLVFHSGLRFIFTAAAPLPTSIAAEFHKHAIPIIEGWGLTETSPCCAVTDPAIERQMGVVGKPIPGVSICLEEDGEILIKGPNVMKGYFHNDKATSAAFTDDHWFRTGDVGEFTHAGLRLISRKDRIFKLSNAEKVVPSEVENLITSDCAYLSHALVTGSGKDYPVVLLFPNKSLLKNHPEETKMKIDCECPQDMRSLHCCLSNCLGKLNDALDVRYYRIQSAMLVDYELSIENGELTPSMKLAPNRVTDIFKGKIEALYDDEAQEPDDVYVIRLK